MGIKLKDYGLDQNGIHYLCFHCPGCGHGHHINVGGDKEPKWSWNGLLELPTFTPSILCNAHDPASRCHSFVTVGKIQFLRDCGHKLAGKTVEIPDWEPIESVDKPVEKEDK